MPIDLRTITDTQKKAAVLIENPERRRTLEQFLEHCGPLVEAAARDALHTLIEEVNEQLAPSARIRLVQEGTSVVPEVVSLGEEAGIGRKAVIDGVSISKVLVRMPSDVKAMATDAAQKAGTSLNNWTVNVLDKAVTSLRDRQQRSEQTTTRNQDTRTGDSKPTEEE